MCGKFIVPQIHQLKDFQGLIAIDCIKLQALMVESASNLHKVCLVYCEMLNCAYLQDRIQFLSLK